MRVNILSGWVIVLLALCAVITPGCCGKLTAVKIVNQSEHAISSVRLVPYYHDDALQEQAIDNAGNLLPVDGEGYAISLAPEKSYTSPFVQQRTVYFAMVTFFIDGNFEEFILETELVDLCGMPRNALLVMHINWIGGDEPIAQVTYSYE